MGILLHSAEANVRVEIHSD